jgi:hypothetical protein
MLWWVLRIQTILDALTCLLVYVFVRNLFGWRDVGLPAPTLLCLQPLPDSLTCFFAAAMLAYQRTFEGVNFFSNSISNDRFQ